MLKLSLILLTRLINARPHTAMWYRIGAVRSISGARRLEPVLNTHLKQV